MSVSNRNSRLVSDVVFVLETSRDEQCRIEDDLLMPTQTVFSVYKKYYTEARKISRFLLTFLLALTLALPESFIHECRRSASNDRRVTKDGMTRMVWRRTERDNTEDWGKQRHTTCRRPAGSLHHGRSRRQKQNEDAPLAITLDATDSGQASIANSFSYAI